MTSMHTLKTGPLILMLALHQFPQPCYAGKVRTIAAKGVDMSQYRTYQWLPTRAFKSSGQVENDPVLTPLIKDAVNRELTRLGLIEVTEGGDLQVATGVTTISIPQVEAVFMPGPDLYYGTPVATMGRYNKKGSLLVNLIDSKTKKSAWAGIADEDLRNTAGDGQKKIAKAAVNLFKKYPSRK